jgi:hypothetical protein
LPGGRGTGSEKIVPICARAGSATGIAAPKAAKTAATEAKARVRCISRAVLTDESGFGRSVGKNFPAADHRLTR